MIPITKAAEKLCRVSPPKISSASTTNKVTSLVIKVRDSVWLIDSSMTWAMVSLRAMRARSRIRSNTITVSFREYPITASIADMAVRSKVICVTAKKPSTQIGSCSTARMAPIASLNVKRRRTYTRMPIKVITSA